MKVSAFQWLYPKNHVRKLASAATALLALTSLGAVTPPAPPPNDMFTNAELETGYHWHVPGVTDGATRENNEPSHNGKRAKASVWYSWTAPSSGAALISIWDQQKPLGAFDVFTGDTLASLRRVKPIQRDKLNFIFYPTNGVTYHIAVDKPKGLNDDRYIDFSVDLLLNTISLTSPTNGAVYKASNSIPLSIVTTEDPAAVAQVAYFGDGVVGVSTSPPYSSVWSNVPPGEWNIQAQLTKTNGTVLTTPVNKITVRPVNDNFADSIVLTGTNISLVGDAAAATLEPFEPAINTSGSIWYSWTAPADGVVAIPRIYDHFAETINAFTNGGLSPLAPPLARLVEVPKSGDPFFVSAGTTLHIAMFGGNLDLKFFGVPANDDFASATEVFGTNAIMEGNNMAATFEPGEPVHSGGAGKSVWFKWTATGNGWLNLEETNAPFSDPAYGIISRVLSIYTGDSLTNLTSIGESGLPANVEVRGGTTYYFAIDDIITNSGLQYFSIDTTFYPAPANDEFTNRIELTGEDATFTYTSLGATVEPGEPNHGPESLWWTWTAPATGTVQLEGVYSPADAAAYTGDTLTNLTFVAAGYDFFFWNVQAGTTYQIAVFSGSPRLAFEADMHLHYYTNGTPIEP